MPYVIVLNYINMFVLISSNKDYILLYSIVYKYIIKIRFIYTIFSSSISNC